MNVSTTSSTTVSTRPLEPATRRRHFPLAAASTPSSTPSSIPSVTYCCTPVPTPAHGSPRAIRVRRSPR